MACSGKPVQNRDFSYLSRVASRHHENADNLFRGTVVLYSGSRLPDSSSVMIIGFRSAICVKTIWDQNRNSVEDRIMYC